MKDDAATTPRIGAVDLFCGAGGMTHGLEKGGISVTLGVDIDENCRFPIEHNNNTKFMNADVSALAPDVILEEFDRADFSLLVGCAPCQPFSTYSQGARAGTRSGEWKLVKEFARLVGMTKPDLVSMENVPALRNQPVFETMLSSLADYNIGYWVIDCSQLGVPQVRKRLVLIASKLRPVAPLQLTKKYETVGSSIKHLPAIKAGESDPNDPIHKSCRLSSLNLLRMQHSLPGGTWRDWPDNLRAGCHTKESGETYPSVYGRMTWDNLAPTITTQCFGYGNGRFGHPEQDRAISLREASILQTFPEMYQFVKEGERIMFARLGRLIGNAVPVKVGEAIARSLVEHVGKHLEIE